MGPVCSLSFSFESPATHTKGMCSPASDGPGYRKYLERSHEQEQLQRKIGETEVTVHLSARTCQVSDYACPPPVFGRSRGVFMRLPVSMRLSRSLATFIRWRCTLFRTDTDVVLRPSRQAR